MHICRGLFAAKTASYAVMHFVVAIAVAYALTLDWRKALAIGIVEPFVQTFAFALHDRYWAKKEAAAVEEAVEEQPEIQVVPAEAANAERPNGERTVTV